MKSPEALLVRSSQEVQIRRLKEFVTHHLSPSSALRQLILAQADEMDPAEFTTVVGDWLLLLNIESKKDDSQCNTGLYRKRP
ncbi:MAG: hypothetical protein HYU39_08505 [Thaumarchaeota archaeon]|nr:hypothetical protein [Nitrososphaerota archaeon]